MSTGLRIACLGAAVPQKQMFNQELENFTDTSDEWIRTRTGIRSRFICQEETCSSLAIDAAEDALQHAEELLEDFSRDQVRVVLVASSTPEYLFPSMACLVQKTLSLPKEVFAMDIHAACSGFLDELITAYGLLKSFKRRAEGPCYALIIGSEQLSKIMDFSDRSTCILFGDGAGAALVELKEQAANPFTWCAWSDGNKDVLYCDGVNQGRRWDQDAKEPLLGSYLQMNGQEVFRFATRAIGEAVEQLLSDSKLTMAEIDYVVCHQANIRIIDHVRRKYREFSDRFYINIEKYGNTSSASIPIALYEMQEKGMLREGMKILCVGFGAGLTWGGVLVEI